MRFDLSKSYPHPVLRPGSSDYPQAEFQVELELDRLRDGTALRVRGAFDLSDPELLALVDAGKANYVLRVLASKTHFRTAITGSDRIIEQTFADGQIHGLLVLSPFLVCTTRLPRFSVFGWHRDYASLCFDVEAGSVLAEDEPKEYWIDTAEEAAVGSIFTVHPSDHNPPATGTWRCRLHEPKVVLEMPRVDYERFTLARARLNGTVDAAYLMNGVYLPALIWVLQEADGNQEQYSDLRWYRALDERLHEVDRPRLGAEGADRLNDAQVLLRSPFGRLPLLSEDR